MTGRKHGLGATRTTFANNLIVGGGAVAKIDGPNPGTSWIGNLLWQTPGGGDLPAPGYSVADPQLARDAHGVWHLTRGSPAIGAAQGEFAFVSVDQDGQPRGGKRDVGADQFSDAPVMARPLTPADVGPASK